MKQNILIIIFLFIAIIAGCSSSGNIVVKSNETANNIEEPVAHFKINRQITNDYGLNFPVSEDPRLLGLLHHAKIVGKLHIDISSYRRATGVYPASISEYIDSGFPLFWPRNVMNGLPVRVLTSRDVINDSSDYGSIKWVKYDNYHARLISSNIDLVEYMDNGEITWIIKTKDLEFHLIDNYLSLLHDELVEFSRYTSPYDLEGAKTIVGGINAIDRVSDPETRMLYAKCGELSDFIFSTTLNYYAVNNSLPNSVVDHLAFQQGLGGTPFIIKENFNKLAYELTNADVELKIGYDYPNTVSYALLKINGETLISHCYKYDYNAYVDPPIKNDSLGIHVGYRMDEIDMSSPMISDSNLSTLNIPDQFLISIEDIPIE